MSLPAEHQDLEGDLQNLSLESSQPTEQPGPSAPPPEEELELEEQLHPSLERYRKHISPAWKDVTEDSELVTAIDIHDYIIYHYNYYTQHGFTNDRLRDQFCDDFYGWTTELFDKANKPIRQLARDFLISNGVKLDNAERKIGERLAILLRQAQETLDTAYQDSIKGSNSPLDPHNSSNRPTTPLSFRTAFHLATQHPSSVHPPSVQASVQATSVQAPSIQAPSAPSAQAPSAQAPSAQAPSAQAPSVQAPSVQAPS
ncbi:hypothetical protein E4U50_004443, partial [Claviceps purpurea]